MFFLKANVGCACVKNSVIIIAKIVAVIITILILLLVFLNVFIYVSPLYYNFYLAFGKLVVKFMLVTPNTSSFLTSNTTMTPLITVVVPKTPFNSTSMRLPDLSTTISLTSLPPEVVLNAMISRALSLKKLSSYFLSNSTTSTISESLKSSNEPIIFVIVFPFPVQEAVPTRNSIACTELHPVEIHNPIINTTPNNKNFFTILKALHTQYIIIVLLESIHILS